MFWVTLGLRNTFEKRAGHPPFVLYKGHDTSNHTHVPWQCKKLDQTRFHRSRSLLAPVGRGNANLT